jgi:hypothetical protein
MHGAFALFLLVGTLTAPGDTLLGVREGDRLVLSDFQGTVFVQTWDRSELYVEAESKESRSFRINRSGSRVELRLAEEAGPERRDGLRMTVPYWMDLEFSGKELEVEVWAVDGDVMVRNIRGDISFRDLRGLVEAYTVEGSIEAQGLTGSARLRTGNDELRVMSSSAALDLETVNGDIELEEIQSRRVSARSTEGEIDFSGRVLGGGDYGFFTHGGDVRLHLSEPVNLDASILTYEGKLSSGFPVRTDGFRSGEGLDFSIGAGGARLVVETFSGSVELMRHPGGG